VPGDEPLEKLAETGEGLDIVELGGLDERGDDRPGATTGLGAGKERVLAAEGDGADGARRGVGGSNAEGAIKARCCVQCAHLCESVP
jgi:hypothetical protein